MQQLKELNLFMALVKIAIKIKINMFLKYLINHLK